MEFELDFEKITGVICGDSQGDVFLKILKHYRTSNYSMLYVHEVKELEAPYFYLHPKRRNLKGGDMQ